MPHRGSSSVLSIPDHDIASLRAREVSTSIVVFIPGDDGDSVCRENRLVRDEPRWLKEHASGEKHGKIEQKIVQTVTNTLTN